MVVSFQISSCDAFTGWRQAVGRSSLQAKLWAKKNRTAWRTSAMTLSGFEAEVKQA
jgi:hypothetical protein